MQTTRFSQLSKPRRILMRLCQQISYGSFLDLSVIYGEVRIDGTPEFIGDVKLDTDGGRRCELGRTDFALPLETCRLLGQIDSLDHGVVEKIMVHDGIPRRKLLQGSFQEVHQ